MISLFSMLSYETTAFRNSRPMTNPKPNKDAGYLEDLRCLAESYRDAMNLINFQWFLYDDARRKAWLEQQMTEPSDMAIGPSGNCKPAAISVIVVISCLPVFAASIRRAP